MRLLPVLLSAALPLAACTPASDAATAAPAAPAAPAAETAPPVAAPVETSAAPAAAEAPPATLPTTPSASVSGAIREGNRPPPALRICAHPVAGGAPTCSDSPAGATDYRLGVAPGRYHVMGWVQGGELALIAHATQIRCIRAPCPPDELITVEVAAGEQKRGIDLSAGYADVPPGWPARP
jgi:hypothetical protein